MSKRVQVILDEAEASRFRIRARKDAKSLSAWLRDAGRKLLAVEERGRLLDDEAALREFFQACDLREKAANEPDWEEHKAAISAGFRSGIRS